MRIAEVKEKFEFASAVGNEFFNLQRSEEWGCVALEVSGGAGDVVAQFAVFAHEPEAGTEFVVFDLPFLDKFVANRSVLSHLDSDGAEVGSVNFTVAFQHEDNWLDRVADLVTQFIFEVFDAEFRENLRVESYTVEPKGAWGTPIGRVFSEREVEQAFG